MPPEGPAPPRPAMPPGHGGGGGGGAPAFVPPNVRAFLDGLSPAATHKLLTELRAQALSQPEPTRHQLLQFPILAQAVVHMMSRMGTLQTGTPAYGAAAAAAAVQPLTLEERQQVEQVKGFMALPDAAVAALPDDSRPAVQQIRYALNTSLEKLMQEQQTDLISLRDELLKLFARY